MKDERYPLLSGRISPETLRKVEILEKRGMSRSEMVREGIDLLLQKNTVEVEA